MAFPLIKLKEVLTESKVEAPSSNSSKRIRVRLHAKGVEKRPEMNDKEGATKYYIRRAGQFVYGRQNLHKGAFGVIPPELDGFQSSSDIPSFDVAARCLPEWVDLFLKQGGYYLELSKLASGVGSQRISPSKFLSLEMPLPSIEQQRAILDQVEFYKVSQSQLLFELTHQQTLLKKLRQQILQEAIEGKLTADWRAQNPDVEPASELLKRIAAEKAKLVQEKKIKAQKPLRPITDEQKPFELPQGWEWCRLDQLIYESPRNGYSPKTVDYPTTTKTLKLGATTSGKFDSTQVKYIDEEISRDSFLWIKPRDILIQRGNSIDFVGVSAIYQGEENCFIYPDLMMKLRPVNALSEVFLHHALMSPSCREYFRSNATGAQKSMPKINQEVVSGALVPLCCEEEQKAIVTKVEQLFALCDQLETQITHNQSHSEQLMQTVLKEAFAHNSEAETEAQNSTVSADAPEVIRA